MSPCLEHFLYNMPSPSHAQKYFHLLQQVRGGCAVGVTYLTLPIGLKHCLVIAYHSNKRAVRCSHCHMCQSFNASPSFTHTHTHTHTHILWIWRSGRWGTREKRIEEGIGSSTPLLTCFAYSGRWIFMVSMSLKSFSLLFPLPLPSDLPGSLPSALWPLKKVRVKVEDQKWG